MQVLKTYVGNVYIAGVRLRRSSWDVVLCNEAKNFINCIVFIA